MTDYLFSECSKTEEVSWRKDWVEKSGSQPPASPYLNWCVVFKFPSVFKCQQNRAQQCQDVKFEFTPICTAIKRLKQDNIKTYGKRKKKAWKMLALCQWIVMQSVFRKRHPSWVKASQGGFLRSFLCEPSSRGSVLGLVFLSMRQHRPPALQLC